MCPILYNKTIEEIINTNPININVIQSAKIINSMIKELTLIITHLIKILISIINNSTLNPIIIKKTIK